MTDADVFDREMRHIYTLAGRSLGYWAHRFLQGVRRRGGVSMAKRLLGTKSVPTDGFRKLQKAGRLDLTVEYLATRPQFSHLFSANELQTAKSRLGQTQIDIPDMTSSFRNLLPEELGENKEYLEGSTEKIVVNAHERNPAARRECMLHWGTVCIVCGFDFEAVYGEIGRGYIHVHHLKPISTSNGVYKLEPRTDLVPVCPNCHAMLHRTDPPLTIEKLRRIISHEKS